MIELKQKIEDAIWVCKSLFERGKVTGSTANISFRYNDYIYISNSGNTFGRMNENSFSRIRLDGTYPAGENPSKEYPLHLIAYKNKPQAQALLHTHSFYSTLWSCLSHMNTSDVIPKYTPYLDMRIGKIKKVPYHLPGSEALFQAFKENFGPENAYLLANHGPVIIQESLMACFYALEELEESAKLAWYLKDGVVETIL